MEKLKILNTPINGINHGGLSTIEFRLGTNMDQNKVLVDFFATYKIENSYYKEIVKRQGGKIFDFDINSKGNVIKRKVKLIKSFYKVLKENKYDIVHIHIDSSFSGVLYGIVVKIVGGSKIIFHSHNTAITGKIKNIMHILFKPMLKFLGDEFATCSDEAAQWMYSKYILKNKNIKMIENGIDVEKFIYNKDIRNEYRKKMNIENNYIIGHVGRFETQKNHEYLIDIFYELYKLNKSVKLVLVGTGKLENKIKEKVKNLKIDNNVLFLESRNDVNNLLQAFDLFLFPSLYEGLPIVAIEAQVAGLNTILSDTITKQTQIIPTVKYISLEKDAEYWASEILKYIVEYDRNKYKKQILESNFNIKKSALNLQNFYLQILS